MSAIKYLTKKVAEAENEEAEAGKAVWATRRRAEAARSRAEDARRELDIAIEDRIRKARGLDTVDTCDEKAQERRTKSGVPV